ncbi:GntR family transcriptional regulator (plasmid) [Mesorhizobium sp. 131-3-5]|uniref:GntR family transcriptional regulator n=1 Tax=Mesorhizobium sp. 131-3-5 TaxID=2744520 RepID=UPI0018EA7809|nr:GntR family transcriptional regulator [Mesorhizobium sp. 131-3-5]BCH12348.1 GntR family transcriptional regulator [Mesorhizobium sp. 131-3-5]
MTILAAIIEPLSKQVSLGEVAYHKLKEIIIQGEFPPNEKLTVRAVAGALGVSTTPARDAINRLLSEGALVYAGPKTVVIPPLTMEILDEITSARLALEGLAAEKSVSFISDADIAQLEKLQEIINIGLDESDYRTVLRANRDFHFLVYTRSNWPRVVSMIESLWLQIGPSLNQLYPEFAFHRKGVSNHLWIMEGLRSRDAQKVRSGFEQDLRDGYDRISAFLKDAADK